MGLLRRALTDKVTSLIILSVRVLPHLVPSVCALQIIVLGLDLGILGDGLLHRCRSPRLGSRGRGGD